MSNSLPQIRTQSAFFILIDDPVFLQHIFGLIIALIDLGKRPRIILGFELSEQAPLEKLLVVLLKNQKCVLCDLKKIDLSVSANDYVCSQWGPPPSIGRRFTKIKRNSLLHKIPKFDANFIAFPHGFEIKSKTLKRTKLSILRSVLCEFSTNPFADYNRFYKRYFFETEFHKDRYHGHMTEGLSKVLGHITFNYLMVGRIRQYLTDCGINIQMLSGKVVILPKIQHVGKIDIQNLKNADYFVLHPREIEIQKKMMVSKGLRGKILEGLDLFSLNRSVELYDFGTSISCLAQCFGAHIVFENRVGALDLTPERYLQLLTTGQQTLGATTYEDYILNVSKVLIDD